jgi:chaperonin GroES
MLTAILDRVVVRLDKPKDKTKGGIILPDQAREMPKSGVILACGPGKRTELGTVIPISVRVGDRVLFGPLAGTDVKMGGEDLLVMAECDILAKIEG